MQDSNETYYEILRVPETASVTEISAAYHAAKQAFSAGNVASYSVLSVEESKEFITKLDAAYQVLSDPKRRKKYDRKLSNPSEGEEKMQTPTQVGQALSETPAPHTIIEAAQNTPEAPLHTMNGARLKAIREQRSLSLEDVARITKIPLKFILALETENAPKMPARVYIQGFVKNLATTYKLNPDETAKAYLLSIDSKIKN